jgi:hypothetical protein
MADPADGGDRDAGRFRHVDALFDALLDTPPARRAEFVERVCGDDVGLRRELLRLLGLVESSGEFLESPAIDVAAPLFRGRPPETQDAG